MKIRQHRRTPTTVHYAEYSPATVDFPTPPFPEATIRVCFTPCMGFFFGRPLTSNSALEVFNYAKKKGCIRNGSINVSGLD